MAKETLQFPKHRILEYLEKHILVADGAMGTYYQQITGENRCFSEMANLSDPGIIRKIHEEYIESGAKLIRTNTFSVNTVTLNIEESQVSELIKRGYELADYAAAGREVFVAADLGPIPARPGTEHTAFLQEVMDEYKLMIDTFLTCGAEIFLFETFSSAEPLIELSRYIKENKPSALIITQFALDVNGYTRQGISAARVIKELKDQGEIDVYGFNCGVGPRHLYNILKGFDFSTDLVSVMPNAGYPEVINERTIYNQNPAYFGETMMEIKDLGVKIIGGCCGTTPRHIKEIARKLVGPQRRPVMREPNTGKKEVGMPTVVNTFRRKLGEGRFVIVVELDPPFNTSLQRIMEGAAAYKENGVDLITIADSPRAVSRADAVTVAAKIRREVGMETMPHLCCRDKNLVALKSTLLAAHIEGIRNILAITGDPVPSAARAEVRSVFNVNSFDLIKLITEMNKEVFAADPFFTGGALNLNVANKEKEMARMVKKAQLGAEFFLTQSIFTEESIEFLARQEKDPRVKILGGIMPIVTYQNAVFLNNELPGVTIPEEQINRFSPEMAREEAEETGVALAVEIAMKLRPFVDGFYFVTPFNRYEMIIKILRQIREKVL
ncbi:MAG TPA: bifunctional homocysteine S-methyltransferase/methylenetetrahydrofolate reductase [Firmicutes bacterium]|nr:bifunctional homocysteine S-methyltransferase/methylenetetrahydrofolate reductase [Bacillota bacterium]